MNYFQYILDRSAFHFTSAVTLVLMSSIIIRTIKRLLIKINSKKEGWLPDSMQNTLIMAALFVFSFSTLREAWDVARGQLLIKAFIDYFSWFLGVVSGCWWLHRWYYFEWNK